MRMLRLIFVALSICTANSVIAQNYDSYFGQNETHVIQINNDYTLGETPFALDSLAITNEIISNDNLVYKEVKHYRHWNPENLLGTFYLREDRDTGQLWVSDTVDGAEFMISDMSLEVGDTVNFFNQYTSFTVNEVIYLNGKKHIYFDTSNYPSGFPGLVPSSDNLFLIEGVIPFTVWENVITQVGLNYLYGESAPVCIIKDGNKTFSIDDYWEIGPPPIFYITDWVTCQLKELYNFSTETFNKIELKLYPNPTYSSIHIESNQVAINKVEIWGLDGKNYKKIKENFYDIDINDFSAGMYIVKIFTDFGIDIQKIIKK